MCPDVLRGGSLKTLLILLLIVGNIVAALPRENARARSNPVPNDSRSTERALSEKQPH